MKSIKLSLAAALLTVAATTLSADFLSEIQTSVNVALTSNYVWRGMTQSDNSPAIQGGFDLGYKGLYAGVWGSNIDFDSEASVEIDLYAGYANKIAGFTYDINYCQYTYPNETDELNFGEASFTVGYDFEAVALSAKYYFGVDTNDVLNDSVDGWKPENGWEVGASVPLPMDISLDATYGDYGSGENSVGEYYSIGVTKSFEKFDITVVYTGMDFDERAAGDDGDGKEDNLVVTLGTSF